VSKPSERVCSTATLGFDTSLTLLLNRRFFLAGQTGSPSYSQSLETTAGFPAFWLSGSLFLTYAGGT
ncbi:hypothetical protein ACFL6S_33990, partial [Candidatus Poribacteria bacterium]